MRLRHAAFLVVAAITAACSADPYSAGNPAAPDDARQASTSSDFGSAAPSNTGEPTAGEATPAGDDMTLTPAGLGAISVGKPTPITGPDALVEEKVQIAEDCRIWRSPRRPGIYVMTDGKVVTRITLMRNSPAATGRGIRLGASEADIRRAYRDLEETHHEYVGVPAKNLIWRPSGGTGGLRFEIDASGRANLIHAGISPWLEYSEGCA